MTMKIIAVFVLLLSLFVVPSANSQSYTYSGAVNVTSMLQGQDGNLYGYDSDGFFSLTPAGVYTVLASFDTQVTLCLQETNGNFLGLQPNSALDVISLSTSGSLTVLGALPVSSPQQIVCPVAANDGDYYGGQESGGTYSKGFLYQVTPAGAVNVIYNFTGTADGIGPYYPMLQASDGNLYGFSLDDFFRYSPASGISEMGGSTGIYGSSDMVEGPDGNFYAIAYQPAGNTYDFSQITSQGGLTYLAGSNSEYYLNTYSVNLEGDGQYYLVGQNDSPGYPCEDGIQALPFSGTGQIGSYSFNTIFTLGGETSGLVIPGGNGSFYGAFSITETYPDEEDQTCETEGTYYALQTEPGSATAPIAMSLSSTHILPGKTATLTWDIGNAYSDTAQQCYAYGSWNGAKALSGSTTVLASAAGSQLYSLQCGGTLTNSVVLTAGNAAITLTPSLTPIAEGLEETLTAQITNVGTPAPTGSIGFYDGSLLLGTVKLSSSGTAVLNASTSGIAPGTYSVTAKYAGDSNYGAAGSAVAGITVIADGKTTLALTTSTPSLLEGQTASLSAVATGNSSAAYHYPTGTVKFYDGSLLLGSATLNYTSTNTSTATFSAATTGIAPGTYSVVAKYSGDGWNAAANSAPVTVTVRNDAVTVTATPSPVPSGDGFTLTATAMGTAATPTGTVIFYAGATAIGTASLNSSGVGTATLASGTLASGTYQVTAYYAGDKNNPADTSAAITLTID